MRRVSVLAGAVLLILFAIAPSHADKRVALVIGNAAYRYLPALTNPRNDAEDVARSLRDLAFETIVATDLDRTGMNDVLGRFARRAEAAEIAIVYYSGHGMQFTGSNYLLPTEARLDDAGDVNRFRLIPLDDVLEALRAAKGARLLVLDACRNNPVEEDLKRRLASLPGANRDAVMTRGLTRASAGNGLLVAYSTQANDVASDGKARNSPFTAAFLRHVGTPDIDLRQMLFRVQDEVDRSTGGRQRPELAISLVGEFKLKMAALPAKVDEARPGPSGDGQTRSEAAQAWAAAKDTTSPAILEAFIRRFGDTFYADMARARLDELKKRQAPSAALPSEAPAVQLLAPARLSTSVFTTGASPGTAVSLPAPPQTSFPSRPVTIIVPFAAGGATDMLARIVGQKFSDILRQSVVVENRPGAGGTTGVTAAKAAAADGYTLVAGTMATHAFGPAIHANAPYDAKSDFTPVGLIAATPMVVVTRNGIAATDLRSFLSYLKTSGAKATYASSGAGSESQVACAFLSSLTGAKSSHIPYRGVAPAVTNLMGGLVDYMCAGLSSIVPQVQSGSIKALAVASAERVLVLPNLPTTGEAGLPEFQASSWTALFAPKGTPQPVVQKLNYALAMALEDAATKQRLIEVFGEIPNRASRSPGTLDAYLRAEVEKWTRVIKAAGISAN